MNEWKFLGRLATVQFWDLALARATRSFLQGLSVAVVGGGTGVVPLEWNVVLLSALGMAIASLITSMMKALPEEEKEGGANE